ncbi:heterogeneous nuclear ribonucleoprotein K-like [Strongylocentrotus purpuratus]|uniref:K Homology domain-containing protein n=1 Tax=Strongylocentrotus purpuratus TaxID=7668 RepID=A0A7M7NBA4_STRPU|nr:heterogeneous nuclear ribonucleoprotein K-like [Strongylocentrotus purpuratus]
MNLELLDDVTFRLLVSSNKAGGVIGKGGQNIKRLRSDYNATVSIPDSSGPDRVLQIVANSKENGLDIIEELIPLIREEVSPFSDGEADPCTTTLSVLVQTSQVGAIIGRAGIKIKELRESTKTKVKVFQECLPCSTESLVQINGTPDAVLLAIGEIYVTCSEAPIKGSVLLYDPSQQEGYVWNQGGFGESMGGGGRAMGLPRGGGVRGMGMRGGGGGQQGSNPIFGSGGQPYGSGGAYGSGGNDGGFAGEATTTLQVTIPNDLVGAVIGRGGERIRNIRSRSQAEIEIANPLPEAEDRVITIRGTQEQISHAQFLLQNCIQQFSGHSS